jgi:SH3-like domain-containing protein
MRKSSARAIAIGMGICVAGSALAADRPVPYWASITAGDALLRTGPGRDYPATWRYRRANLPVIVLQVHESWRRVRDFEGS